MFQLNSMIENVLMMITLISSYRRQLVKSNMNCLSLVVAFCVLHNFAFGSDEDYSNPNPVLNNKQHEYEVNAGSKTGLLENKHYYNPSYYSDLSRRFVPVYPYEEKPKQLSDDDALASLKDLIQASQTQTVDKEAAKLIPVRAPSELVIAIAKESAKLKSPRPSLPTEKVLTSHMLRSGDYWNGIWTESVDPSNHLRTNEKKPPSGSVKAKVMPGSKLYDLVLALQQMSPRLLYIINDNKKNK